VLAVSVASALAQTSPGTTSTGTTPAAPAKVTPYRPPPTVTVGPESLPPESEALDRVIALRNRAAPASRERADLNWLIAFARLASVNDSPSGRRVTAARALRFNAFWYAGHRSPNDRVIARDPDGVLLTYRRGHGFIVNPVATMGRWRDLNIAWSAPQLADAIGPMMIIRRYAGREWGALEYYDVPGKPDQVVPGVSAMGQGRAAALFAKAWRMTGDPQYARNAELALGGFQVPVNAGGVFNIVRIGRLAGAWYPERAYPGKNPWTGSALNGFMATIIGLHGSALDLAAVPRTVRQEPSTDPSATTPSTSAAPDPAALALAAEASGMAESVAQRGVASLVTFLPAHDTGAWSYYGLLTPGRPWRTNLADLNYHCYHVHLLKSLSKMYPGRGFDRYQLRWQGYVWKRDARCPAR
jgi:hypothetical protein